MAFTAVVHAEMAVRGCDAEFSVNDIPVGVLRRRRRVYAARPCHEFLVRGANTLSVKIVSADAPESGHEGSPVAAPPGAELKITVYAVGAIPGNDPGRVLAALPVSAWTAPGVPGSAAGAFDLSAWPYTWEWQSLPVIPWPNDTVLDRARQYLVEFSRRMAAGDTGWLVHALQLKMADYCRAYELDLDAEIADLGRRTQARSADPTFQMTALSPADVVLRPCAGRRLLDTLRSDGRPAIRWKDARVGNDGEIELRIGWRQDEWRVFR